MSRSNLGIAFWLVLSAGLSACSTLPNDAPDFMKIPPPPPPVAWQPYYCYQTLGRVSCFADPQPDMSGQMLTNQLQPDSMTRKVPYVTGVQTGTPPPGQKVAPVEPPQVAPHPAAEIALAAPAAEAPATPPAVLPPPAKLPPDQPPLAPIYAPQDVKAAKPPAPPSQVDALPIPLD